MPVFSLRAHRYTALCFGICTELPLGPWPTLELTAATQDFGKTACASEGRSGRAGTVRRDG